MPRFNGTGPCGQGPMTGRGMGPCNPQGQGGAGRGTGRGAGRGGFFGGMFRRNGFATPPVQDKASLENEVEYLKEDLKAAQDRLKTMGDE